jgi:hypothetical protein
VSVVRTLIATALALGALAAPASAAIWTPIESNTTDDITAIEYQGADRFWYTTANGRIFKRVGSVFEQKKSVPGVVFRDVEFQAGGGIGLAVGSNGNVWRSTDSGDTWNQVTLPLGGRKSEERCDLADESVGDIDSVRFDGLGNAWFMAQGSQIFRSPAGPGVGTGWVYMNDAGATCKIGQNIDDAFFVPGSPAGYFIARSFGGVWFTADNLASAATQKPGDAGNGFTTIRRVAGDPANPNRQWTVTPGNGGFSYFSRTTDGWGTDAGWDIGNPSVRELSKPSDVDYAGGTVLAAGSAGLILHSIDGATFFHDGAAADLATRDWLSVGLASASEGAVGGSAGKMVVTSQANVTPDVVAPTGTISGPASIVAGQAATFTAVIGDSGGSGLNPGATAWTVTGLGNQSGATATYTFPSAGLYTVKVTFADNAGNTGTASRSVSVMAASGGGPTATPTLSLSGPGNTASAVIVGDRVRVRMRGTIKPPAGVSTAAACTGKVRLTIKKRKKVLFRGRAALQIRQGKCRFGKTVFLKRSKVGAGTRLRLRIRFPGNSVLREGSVTKTLVVKR